MQDGGDQCSNILMCQVPRGRLVDAAGIVNAKGFYNYLSAWASNDALAYSASQGNLRPEPRQWVHSRQDVELRVPKSAPLAYAQMPFYLRSVHLLLLGML